MYEMSAQLFTIVLDTSSYIAWGNFLTKSMVTTKAHHFGIQLEINEKK